MWLTKIKASPYWYVRFKNPDPKGKPVIVSLSTESTNRRQALARGRELELECIEDYKKKDANAPRTSKQVVEEYWETEASTRKASVSHIFPHLDRIDRFLGDKLYHEVSIADVARFADKMKADGFSPSTVNRALSVWRRMHNVAFKVRLYQVKLIPWREVRKDEPSARDAHLTEDQIRTIFAAMPTNAREIAMFGLLVGLRKSQVLTLAWDRVDLDHATVTVYRKHRKALARHTIPIHEAALRLLERRRAASSGNEVFEITNFRKHWEKAVSDAGLKGVVRFHDLRHAFATMAAQTTPLHILQEMLGHSTIGMTSRYAHARSGDMRAALKRLPMIDI